MVNKLTSRERVLRTLDHKEPDRIPIDLGSTPITGISALAYHHLKQYLKIKTGQTRVYDLSQQLAIVEDEIINRFDVDVLDIGRTFNTKAVDWQSIQTQHVNPRFNNIPLQYPIWYHPKRNPQGGWDLFAKDGTLIAQMPKDGFFIDQIAFPWSEGYPSNPTDPKVYNDAMGHLIGAVIPKIPEDHYNDADYWNQLRTNTLYLREHSDKALVANGGGKVLETINFLRRMDKLLVDLLRMPEKVEKILDVIVERNLILLKKLCKSVGDIVDVIRFSDDLGEENGPLMSPRLYRKYFKPRHAKLCEYVKSHSKAKIFLHSCGSIADLIPDLIEVGFDILNPVQINAKGMDPVMLKTKFGDSITFWGGGADTRNVLNSKPPAEVSAHVIAMLKIFAPNGGFVFNQVHNMLADIPPENIVAMLDTVRDFHYN